QAYFLCAHPGVCVGPLAEDFEKKLKYSREIAVQPSEPHVVDESFLGILFCSKMSIYCSSSISMWSYA
ncbi:unnamed protein product, partial [Amoebophrya sp. A25]